MTNINSYHQEPAIQTITLPDTLPSVRIGTDHVAPGPWAEYVKRVKWEKAVKGTRPKSNLLGLLLSMPNVNEPILRVATRNSWTPSLFSEKIGASLANVEAVLIQVVGTRAEVPCTHCQEGLGPFAHCVRIAGDQTDCGNCHWGGNQRRCSFNTAPATPAPTRVRRRKMTDEQYRAHQQTIRELREQKGHLVGLRKERSLKSTIL